MVTARRVMEAGKRIGPQIVGMGRPSGRLLAVLSVTVLAVGLFVWFGPLHSSESRDLATPQVSANVTIQQLLPVLTRSGVGPQDIGVDLTYAPPLLFQVTGQETPDGEGLVFFIQENVHVGALPPLPPEVYLRIDGAGRYPSSQAQVVQEDIHHRTSRLLFRGVPVSDSIRSMSIVVPMENGTVSSGNTLTWELPLQLPDGSTLGAQVVGNPGIAQDPDSAPGVQLASMTKALRRVQKGISYGDVDGIELTATYATSEYVGVALPTDAASRYQPDRYAVFLLSETAHTRDLPDELPPVALRLGERTYQPDLVERRVSSPHHRVTMLRFPVDPKQTRYGDVMDLRLPDGSGLSWRLPVVYEGTKGMSPFGVTWASLLAVLGGMIAAMWPCLFQLTVFFIPTLAGLNMQEASGAVALRRRMKVVKAALFFVLGFTLVYTVAGALIGFAAQRLGDTPNFEQWQRYVGIVGGMVIIGLALRTAAKVRAPLVCKMPVLSKIAHSQKAANPLELMLAGLAFATGCMTCFGAALVIAMVIYVGLSGSVVFGALTLFLFSLGMGIPLVIAATFMAKVLPTLFRLEKVIPWMGLASSILMVGFAILLITGNYMALTEWVYRTIPGAGLR